MTELELQNQRNHKEDLQRLRGFRPVDDTFMRILFRDKLPLAEYVLRIITAKPDLHPTKEQTQKILTPGRNLKNCRQYILFYHKK